MLSLFSTLPHPRIPRIDGREPDCKRENVRRKLRPKGEIKSTADYESRDVGSRKTAIGLLRGIQSGLDERKIVEKVVATPAAMQCQAMTPIMLSPFEYKRGHF